MMPKRPRTYRPLLDYAALNAEVMPAHRSRPNCYLRELEGMIDQAMKEEESMCLSGVGPEDLQEPGERPPLMGYRELEAGLRHALRRVRFLKRHTHEWDSPEEHEMRPTRCIHCGVNGDA